jgi:hypothetical protein
LRFRGKGQKAPCIGEQSFAFLCQAHALAFPVQKRPANVQFQPLDLLANRGLRAVNALARTRKAAGINNRNEAAQEIEVEHNHSLFHWILAYHLI